MKVLGEEVSRHQARVAEAAE